MPKFQWLKMKGGKTTGYPQNSRNSPIISDLFHKIEYIMSVFCRCKDDISVDYAGCQCDRCKSAKTRVAQFLDI